MNKRKVKDLITRSGVVTLAPTALVREACQLMSAQGVGACLVMEGERIAGMFTERDAMKRVVAEGVDPDTTPLAEVMTRDVVTLEPGIWAVDALRVMIQVGIRHLPVVEQDVVIGMISLRDFVGAELQQAGTDAAG